MSCRGSWEELRKRRTSVLVTVAAGGAVVAGWAAVAQGLTNVVAGAGAISHAMSMSSGGSSGGGSPAPSSREQRLEELSTDPAKGNKSTPQSKREAEIGLDLESQGKLHGIKRDPTGGAEFVDANGTYWDIKGFVSGNMKGGFRLADATLKIERELLVGENVIVDTAKMSAQDISALQAEAAAKNWGNRVWFYP
jgi:hypothetical protein